MEKASKHQIVGCDDWLFGCETQITVFNYYLFLSTSNMSSHSLHFDHSARCACCGTHCRITECSECQSLTWNCDNFGRLYMFSLGLSVTEGTYCRTMIALIRRRHAYSSGTEDLMQTKFINSHWLTDQIQSSQLAPQNCPPSRAPATTSTRLMSQRTVSWCF